MKRSRTTYTFNKKGHHLVLDDIPAWICTQCGEPYFEGKKIDAIQDVLRGLEVQVSKMRKVMATQLGS
jgi:YgiT-type zinc finger domain-containing protein